MLGSTPALEKDNRARFSERVGAIADKFDVKNLGVSAASASTYVENRITDAELDKASQGAVEIATEQIAGQVTSVVKGVLFSA
jgi:hypothetical protein